MKAAPSSIQKQKNGPKRAVFCFLTRIVKSADFPFFLGRLRPKKPGFKPFSGLSRFFQLPGAPFLILHTNSQQGYTLEDDRDEQDKTALHVLGYDAAGVPVCTARMFEERPGVWHIGRVATCAPQRGKGYAGAMMREMCREAAAL